MFAGMPPEYPLFWGLKNIEAFCIGDAMLSSPPGNYMLSSPPGGIVVGVPACGRAYCNPVNNGTLV